MQVTKNKQIPISFLYPVENEILNLLTAKPWQPLPKLINPDKCSTLIVPAAKNREPDSSRLRLPAERKKLFKQNRHYFLSFFAFFSNLFSFNVFVGSFFSFFRVSTPFAIAVNFKVTILILNT